MMMYSELEMHVVYDMEDNGFDPENKEDIETYWKERLPE